MDCFDNKSLNKYKNNLKMEKIINVLFYLWIDSYSNFIQFHYRLIIHQKSSNFHAICNGFNLTVFDELSNDNKIWMTMDGRKTYL
jgi:hypothetical protein